MMVTSIEDKEGERTTPGNQRHFMVFVCVAEPVIAPSVSKRLRGANVDEAEGDRRRNVSIRKCKARAPESKGLAGRDDKDPVAPVPPMLSVTPCSAYFVEVVRHRNSHCFGVPRPRLTKSRIITTIISLL